MNVIFIIAMLFEKGSACDLLAKKEVEEIMGEKIDSVELQAGYGNCIYYKKDKVFGQVMNLPIATVGFSRNDVQAIWSYWSSISKKEIISDVGGGAIWAPEYDFFVCRVKGGLLMISLGGSSDDDKKKEIVIKLAKKVITRIKP